MPREKSLAERLYRTIQGAKDNTVSNEDLIASVEASTKSAVIKDAINALLKKNLIVLLQDEKTKEPSYRALSFQEAKIKSELSDQEHLVYSAISSGKNKGIWRKTLISNTKLHVTVADKAIKKLLSMNLIKLVKDVTRPTRKVYMLYDLEPSQDMTGGPWYSDSEFDIAFIEAHAQAILKYIREATFPKPRPNCSEMLYPTSSTKQYPSITKITAWLKSVAISDTPLDEENVRTLLDMLVYSGEIEPLPALLLNNDEASSDSEEESSDEEEEKSRKRKRKAKNRSKSDSESDDDRKSASSSSRGGKKRKKRSKDSDSGSGSGSESEFGSDDERGSRKKGKKKKRKARRDDSDSDDDSEQSEVEEQDSDTSSRGRKGSAKSKSRSRSRSKSTTRKKKRRDDSSDENSDVDRQEAEFDMSFADVDLVVPNAPQASNATRSGPRLRQDLTLSNITSPDRVVYRALQRHPNPGGLNLVMGGWSQSPCGHCPRFDFCDDSGPINPVTCLYFDGWFEGEGNADAEEGEGQANGEEDVEEDEDGGGGPIIEIGMED